jgi:hypothetical protein
MLVRWYQCIADCLDRAQACREQVRASTSLASHSDFLTWRIGGSVWLQATNFRERLTSSINDQDAHKRNIRTLLYRASRW